MPTTGSKIMSIPTFIAMITGVGKWVIPNKLSHKCSPILLELSTFKHQTNNALRSAVILTMVLLKTEKRPVLSTNRFSLQAGIKPP
jgi:hypothetical protein